MTKFSSCLSSLVFGRTRAGGSFLFQESLSTGTSGAVTSTFVNGVWTASGAIANVNTLLAALVFTPSANYNSTFSIATSVSDGVAAPITGSKVMTGIAVNDAPTATNAAAALAGTVTEAGNLDDGTVVAGTPSVAGTLTASDVDTGATQTWSIVGTPSATYGDIVINPSTGVWTYTLDNSEPATDALKEGETVSQTYTARVTDDFGATADQTITITITGTNDVPVVTNTAAARSGSVTEAGSLDDGTPVAGTSSAGGTLTASDVDSGATRSWSIQGAPSTTYGTLAIDPLSGAWTYSLDDSKTETDALKEGETVTETYIARVTDDFGAYAEQIISVTINGSNDVPVVTNNAAGRIGTVTEAGNLDNGTVVPGTPTATGTLTASDVDRDATKTWSIVGPPSTTYGSMAINPSTGVWIYSLDNSKAATQALQEGQIVTETFTARVNDEFGASADQTISVTINGTNDSPNVRIVPGNSTVQYSDDIGNWEFYAKDVDHGALIGSLQLGSFAAVSLSTATPSASVTLADAGTIGSGLSFAYTGYNSLTQEHRWTLSGKADFNAYAGTSFQGPSQPYTIRFAAGDAADARTGVSSNLTVTQEDALLQYTGASAFYTATSKITTADVIMEGLLTDTDSTAPGAILTAKAKFDISSDGGLTFDTSRPWQNTSLLSTTTPDTAYSSYFSALGSGGTSQSYVIRMQAGGNYTGNASGTTSLNTNTSTANAALSSLAVVSVIQNGGIGFMGGGGTIGKKDLITGNYLGKYGQQSIGFLNFGFNTKYNKTGTNLLGNTTVLVRGYFDADSDIDTYLIKSNATDTLTKQSEGLYQFTAKANMFDTNNNNAPIESGCLIKAIGFDSARTPLSTDVDAFAFSLLAKSGELLFSTGFSSGTSLAPIALSGGNIHVG